RMRTPLIGRQAEISQICELLVVGSRPLVTLVGAGGIGKSRLALAVAETLVAGITSHNGAQANRFRDGIWYVPMAEVDADQEAEMAYVTAIADAIQLRLGGTDAPLVQLVDFLCHKQLLLLLDNLEHLVDGALLFSEILADAAGVQMLVTSRTPLQLQEEWRYAVQGMALPALLETGDRTTGLAALRMNDSIALFTQAAQRVDHQFVVDDENWAAVIEICRYVHGLPLALELAAMGLAQMHPEALARGLIHDVSAVPAYNSHDSTGDHVGETGLDLLQTPLRNVPDRHRTIRNVFRYSWQLLTAQEQQMAMQFALFRGGCERLSAVTVTTQRIATLTGLVNKSLVQHDGDGRYMMHALLRQFCLEQAARDPESALAVATRRRYITHYLELIST
ncbi:MAG: hypothetical protein KDE31_33415, partial [Caldilineaceae bacterium]|nr:hypothetical protein [Caldilineaceae bacterium]